MAMGLGPGTDGTDESKLKEWGGGTGNGKRKISWKKEGREFEKRANKEKEEALCKT